MTFPAPPFFTLAGSSTVILSMAAAASAILGSTNSSAGGSSASSTLAMSGRGSSWSWGSSSGKRATGWTGPGTEMERVPPLPLPAGPLLPRPLTLATWQSIRSEISQPEQSYAATWARGEETDIYSFTQEL